MSAGFRRLMALMSCVVVATTLGCTRHASESAAQGPPPAHAPSRADNARPSGSPLSPRPSLSPAQLGEPRFLKPTDLTPQERKYGVSPTRNSQVTYQPEVLIVENGSQAIRGQSNDGLTWRVDASAVPADEIKPGRVIFLTSRAVGRVLNVRREGQELAILLGPVELTDVIRDCNVSLDQSANFGDAITYTLPDLPGRGIELPPIAATSRDQWFLPVQTGQLEPYLTNPIAKLGTVGTHIGVNKGGVQLGSDVAFHFLTPRVFFRLVISAGTVNIAELRVSGAAGFNVSFTAVAKDTGPHSFNDHVQVPADISIPVGGPFPITITVRQQFIVGAGFGAPGVLRGQGDYEFGGEIALRYSRPDFKIGRPGHFHGEQTLLNSIQGVSLVPSYASITHQIKIIGGFGAFNFVVGPYVYLNTNANVTRHGDTDVLAGCNFAGFNMLAGTGIGYVIPQPVVKFINAILEALNVKQIRGEGGFDGPKSDILTAANAAPEKPICMNAIADGKAPSPPKSAKPK